MELGPVTQTVVSAVLIYVLGQITQRFVLDPLADQRKTIGEIASALLYLGNISNVAIGAGELERAIGPYTGPLLDGFHLPGASEFEHWADGERDRLRRLYARSLAEAAEERREGAAR